MRWLMLTMACDAPAPEPALPPPATVPAPEPAPEPVWPTIAPEGVVVDVVDLETLQGLEAGGYALADVLGGGGSGPLPNDALAAQVPRYRGLAAALGEDLEALADQLERDLVVEHRDARAWPSGNVGRRLDPRWLSAVEGAWSLAAVVNRIDRMDFAEGPSCGDVRLVYRLGYQSSGGTGSRLPVTLNAVMAYPAEEDCGAIARRWVAPADMATALSGLTLKQLEVNAQVVRFPSGLETQFGGQALYLLTVFAFQGDEPVRVPLENTPDVLGIAADPARKAALRDWIAGNAARIDQGTHQLPVAFRAERALSWSTLGINRSANKPFSAIFDPEELPAPPEGAQWAASAEGLLERLDNGSCTGCHQAGSTAGFHMLGEDHPEQSGLTNRLLLPASPHYHAELPRRQAYVAALASGAEPDRFRPHSLQHGGTAAAGGSCIPDAHHDDVAQRWGCPEGLRCEVVARDPGTHFHFGQCVAPADTPEAIRSGALCRDGVVSAASHAPREGDTIPAFNAHSDADRLQQQQRYGLPEDKRFSEDAYNCRPPVIGVPLGRAFRRCTAQERSLTAESLPGEVCAIVGGSRFDRCVEEDFHQCLAGIVGRGMVDGCSLDRPCREDYICQQLPWPLESIPDEAGAALTEAGVGFCTPTYFLFQLRLDGHPVPTTSI